jgi:hypothetical protein
MNRSAQLAAVLLAPLLWTLVVACAPAAPQRLAQPRPIDPAAAKAAGLRRIEGKHLTLYTDLPADDEVDALPAIFDLAVPQWCAYFGVDPARVANWRVNGFLMQNRERFERAGAVPADLPKFANGYSRGGDLWFFNQSSVYYRRHLFLHEGTHSFMNNLFGVGAAPWYVEGAAELLATHAYRDGELTLNRFPQNRRDVPGLGRIEIVQNAVAKNEGLEFADVLSYNSSAHLQIEPYGWCWALAAFLDAHPRYRDRYRALAAQVESPEFTRRFMKSVQADWPQLNEEWRLFTATLQYGHDVARTAIDFTPADAVVGDMAEVRVAADRGWRNTGLRLEAGRTYQFSASGRYQLKQQPQVWWCEPGGVTIRYHAGRPLGRLQAAVRPDEEEASAALLDPIDIGLGAKLKPEKTGALYLKINDSPGELADNEGEARVVVARE